MFWGYTPALNLNKEFDVSEYNETVNILLMGTADGRHIIKTIAEAYKYPNMKYNFYIVETWMEQIARQVLFLNTLLEPDTSLTIHEKARIFMELYGNITLRPPVARYLYKKSAELVEAITDSTYKSKMMPIFNFDQLISKDRDYLENVFKFWKRPESEFGIQKAWDFRVRKALGQRYSYRNEVFDWDYSMRLCELDAKIISPREYMNWRESGIAFTWSKTNVSMPNLTYGSRVLGNGLKLFYHGYPGDIVVGPYITYGIESDNEKMFTQSHNVYDKRSIDVMEYNLIQMFHQTCYHEPYLEEPSPYVTNPDLRRDLYADFDAKKYDPNDATPLLPLNNVTVTFLSKSNVPSFYEQYGGYFDLMVFGNEQLDAVNKILLTIGKHHSKILFETRKFMIQLKRDDIRDYGDNILKKANRCKLRLLKEFDPVHDTYARFEKYVMP